MTSLPVPSSLLPATQPTPQNNARSLDVAQPSGPRHGPVRLAATAPPTLPAATSCGGGCALVFSDAAAAAAPHHFCDGWRLQPGGCAGTQQGGMPQILPGAGCCRHAAVHQLLPGHRPAQMLRLQLPSCALTAAAQPAQPSAPPAPAARAAAAAAQPAPTAAQAAVLRRHPAPDCGQPGRVRRRVRLGAGRAAARDCHGPAGIHT